MKFRLFFGSFYLRISVFSVLVATDRGGCGKPHPYITRLFSVKRSVWAQKKRPEGRLSKSTRERRCVRNLSSVYIRSAGTFLS